MNNTSHSREREAGLPAPPACVQRAGKRPSRQAGNAVTLTLLGLAVAILAGVVVLYYIGKQVFDPVVPIEPEVKEVEEVEKPVEVKDPRADWRSYTNDEYGFTVQYPPGWLVSTGTILAEPVITLAPGDSIATTVDRYHVADMRVSVYPRGIPTDGLFEQEQESMLVLEHAIRVVDYTLESGRAWATLVEFDTHPDSWTDAGFIFTRVAIEEEQITYMRGNEEVSLEEYDAYAGDTTRRRGFIDTASRDVIDHVLRSFQFTADSLPDEGSISGTEELIRVTEPKPGAEVLSPLTVRGEARGTWFFEASFPVSLETADGLVLATVPATALEDWMTEAFVPFEVSIAFVPPAATSGRLILEKSNPSGLPEHSDAIVVPVSFAQ